MPDIPTLIASIRKEVGGAEPGTLFGDVLELCAWAAVGERALRTVFDHDHCADCYDAVVAALGANDKEDGQ